MYKFKPKTKVSLSSLKASLHMSLASACLFSCSRSLAKAAFAGCHTLQLGLDLGQLSLQLLLQPFLRILPGQQILFFFNFRASRASLI